MLVIKTKQVVKKEYSMKAWTIRSLKRAKISETYLVKIYCALIRSCIEYAVPAYAHFLTGEQSNDLERLQMRSLKTIFGFDLSYAECLERSGLERLDSRRDRLVLNFTKKTAANPLWDHWFPKIEEFHHDLRKKRTYKEEFASKERLRLSPIFTMRRLMNEL